MKIDKEFIAFLLENKRQFDQAVEDFEKHSLEFDRKLNRIRSHF